MGKYTHMLNQTITHKAISGTNDYGELELSAGTSLRARFEFVDKMTHTNAGTVIPISAEAYIEPDVSIATGDVVEYDGETYRVQGIEKVPDGTGTNQLTILRLGEFQ